jgi:hypothetical protein
MSERQAPASPCRCGWFLVDLEGIVTDERLPEETRLRSWVGSLFWSFFDPRYQITVRHLRLSRTGDELPVQNDEGEMRWIRVYPSATGRGFVIRVALRAGCVDSPPAGFAGYEVSRGA